MSIQELRLVRLLAEKIGIKTAGELKEFKERTQADTNDKLLNRLFVANKEAVHYQ